MPPGGIRALLTRRVVLTVVGEMEIAIGKAQWFMEMLALRGMGLVT